MYVYKYVVFDLDETLGYFTELGIFWDSLKSVLKKNLNQIEFNKICDLYVGIGINEKIAPPSLDYETTRLKDEIKDLKSQTIPQPWHK